MKLWLSISLLLTCASLSGQVNSFPYNQSFEEAFTTGTNIAFIPNWTGNKVANSNRIHQGSDARTGASSLNIVPISSFSGEINLSLNLTGINNPKVSFYAYSKKNGSSSSSRPVILNFSTSIDGGATFIEDQQIGDDTTFPNDNSTSYTQYSYELPAEATNSENVIVKITAARGSGSGSAAELILDDFLIEQQSLPLEIQSAVSTSSTSVVITFNQPVTEASATEISNYTINNDITISKAVRTEANQVTLTTSEFTNAAYSLEIDNIIDSATNTSQSDLTITFSYVHALSLKEIKVIDKNTLEVEFNLLLEKESAESSLNYAVNLDIGNPISAQLTANGNRVRLSFSNNLVENQYELTVNNLRDESTLATASNLTSIFGFLPLKIDRIIANSSTEIVVTFNQGVLETSASETSNYNIDNGIDILNIRLDSSNQVILSSSELSNGEYSLIASNIKDDVTSINHDDLIGHFSFIQPLSINKVTVIDQKTLEVEFNLSLDKSTAEDILNYTIDSDIGNPTSVTFSEGSKAVRLLLNKAFKENNYDLIISGVRDASTLALSSNLIGSFNYLPLEIDNIMANSATEVEITFNQSLENTSSTTSTNYLLNYGLVNPISAVQTNGDASKITLTLSKPMVNNTYTLTIDNVKNNLGNAQTDKLSANIAFAATTHPRQIVINEIFADPSGDYQPEPTVLPKETGDEYVELYNVSNSAIDIGNFELSGGRINSFVLAPKGYVILTSSSNVSDLEGFGDVVSVTSWNTLSNGGEHLQLKDNLGNIVDSLTYDLSWYKHDQKADGGWSIAQVNPELSCSDINNWSASTSSSGGTPGSTNSIFDTTPDTQLPNLVSTAINSDQELILLFDELMDVSSLLNTNYTLDNWITVSSISLTSNARFVVLNLDRPMTSGLVYTLSVSGATDCVGNDLAIKESNFLFDNLPPVLERIVLRDPMTIDLFFDEVVTFSSSEDRDNYSIQPIGIQPSKAAQNDTNLTSVRLNLDSTLVIDSAYSLTYQNLSDTLGNTIETASYSFYFKNEVDTLVVISNHLLDVYLQRPPNLESAERLNSYQVDNDINQPEAASLDIKNDRLIHLVFNNNFPENKLLSIAFDDLFDLQDDRMQLLNTTFIYDTDDPDVDSLVVLDENSLQVYFDEPLGLTSAESINNYQISILGARPSLATLSENKESVILDFSMIFTPEETYKLTLTGIEDLSGNRISSNRNYNFIFDLLAPQLQELRLLSPKIISLKFSEAINKAVAEHVTNYTIDNSIGTPISAELSKRDSRTIKLRFDSLGNNTTNLLEISNISDLQGNTIVSSLTSTFSSLRPALGTLEILSDTSILVQFTRVLSTASAQALANYSFNGLLKIGTLFQNEADGSIVHINLSAPMMESTEYTFSAVNLVDTDGNISESISYNFSFESLIEGVRVLNQNTLVIDFEIDLAEVESETATNYLLLDTIGTPLSAVRDMDEKSQITLLFDQPLQNDQRYSLRVQHLKDVFDNNIPSSTIDFIYDVSAPEIVAVNPVYLNEIEVVFNEPIDPTTARTLNHYALNDQVEPTAISFSEDTRNIVMLTFLDNLSDGTHHTLAVKRVLDLSGNQIADSTFGFTFEAPETPMFRDIVINEIYFDTDPDALLPNNEFIEVYNRSDKSFLLTDFAITDKRDTATLPSVSLAANSHLILTNRAGENNYSTFGKTLGLSRFPSLSNAGETIFLLDRNLNIIDSLGYDQSYYNDTHKASGGFTIELINPDKHCFDVDNYHASNDDLGGTPGKKNSVFDNSADSIPPIILTLDINATNQLSVSFNEAMDISSITQDKFRFSHGISISNIDLVGHFGKVVLIDLEESFSVGEVHTISISGVVDCSGNLISDTTLSFSQGAPPQFSEIIITEIMAAPSPSQGLPEAEYLEVLNVSDKILSLSGVTLSDASNSTTLGPFDINPGEYLILTPAATASQFMNFGQVLAVNSWPSLNNATDNISLHNPVGVEIFSIQYDDSWYKSTAKAEGGFSIEIIDPKYPCLLETNWAGSENSLGGSPGTINSINGDNPDLQGPRIINAISLDQSTVQIDFNEPLNNGTIALENFRADNDLEFIALSINDNSVTLTTDVDLMENTIYQITTNNITDCTGNLINSNNNSTKLIIAGKAEPSDVLINEILFNPKSGGVRFVEIYNNSEKYINLKNWRIAGLSNLKVISEENFFMEPISFLTITNDGTILSGQYPNARAQTFIEISSMPSLASDAGSIFIKDENDLEIDGLDYDEDYHSSLIKNYDGVSLERLRFTGASNDPNNWFSAASTSNNATPGYKNSQSSPLAVSTSIITVDPQTFAPDIPGFSNFTTINYSFDAPGNVVNLKIMSADGKLIKQLAQNAVTGTEGFFRWDGINTRGTKARVGYYMILFEVISSGGQISYLLDKVVISSRFQPN